MVEWCCQEETEVLGGKPVTVSLCSWRDIPSLLINEISRSHTTTHHSRQNSSGRVISSSQRPLSNNIQHSQRTNVRAPRGIRTHNPSRHWVAANVCRRARGHWDRQNATLLSTNLTRTDHRLNPAVRYDRPATDRRSHGTRPWTPIYNWYTENQLPPHSKLTASPWQRSVSHCEYGTEHWVGKMLSFWMVRHVVQIVTNVFNLWKWYSSVCFPMILRFVAVVTCFALSSYCARTT